MSNKILQIKRLSSDTSRRDVSDLFGRYGHIKSVNMGKHGTALVKFDDYRDSKDALALDGHELNHSRIHVEYYHKQKEYNNDEIMQVWLEENISDEDNTIFVDESNKIPLYFGEFLDWIKVNPSLTFIFDNEGTPISLLNDNSSLFITAWITKEGEKVIIFEKILDVNTDNKAIRNIGFQYVAGRRRRHYELNKDLRGYFEPSLKPEYTRAGRNIERTFKINSKQWKNRLEQFFHLKLQPTSAYFSGDIPKNIRENGQKIKIELKLTYSNVSLHDRIIFVGDHTFNEEEIKNELNKLNNFGYYNMNVLSVKVMDVNTKYHSKGLPDVNIQIKVISELIKVEDYYITIGEFRTIWENICVRKRFSPAGLDKIAKELNIDLDEASDPCEVIGEVVNNLTWSNFTEDSKASITAYVKFEDDNDPHRAVRELNGKKFKGNKIKVTEYDDYTIEVSNLPSNIKKEDVRDLFGDLGIIKNVTLI